MFIGENYVLNGQILTCSAQEPSEFTDRNTVYEVIRVINGVAVFCDEHFKRLKSSWVLKSQYPVPRHIPEMLRTLKKVNKIRNGNVRIMCSPDTGNVFVGEVEGIYPNTGLYNTGVATASMHWERTEPHVKASKPSLNSKAAVLRDTSQVFEALLVNQNGYFTEGSRSNVFFVDKDSLVTAPVKYVLEGITRRHVIEACKKNGIRVKEELVHMNDLDGMGAAFLTGTSQKVLPISTIDKRKFEVPNARVQKIMQVFEVELQEHVAKGRNVL